MRTNKTKRQLQNMIHMDQLAALQEELDQAERRLGNGELVDENFRLGLEAKLEKIRKMHRKATKDT